VEETIASLKKSTRWTKLRAQRLYMSKQNRNLMLCFQTDDEEAIELALRYWATDADGSWNEKVKALCEDYGLRTHEITKRINSLSPAYDLNKRCPGCGVPMDISSRTAYDAAYESGSFVYVNAPTRMLVCPVCKSKAVERATNAEKKADERKQEMVYDAVMDWLSEDSPEVDALEYLDAVYLYAVLLAANDMDEAHDTFGPASNFIAPLAASKRVTAELLRRLCSIRAIVPAEDSPTSAFEFDVDNIKSFDLIRVKWQLSASLSMLPVQTLLNALSSMIDAHTNGAGLVEIETLWKLVSMSECENVLLECAEYYKFNELTVGERTKHALEYALEKYSVPQVWGIIWSATKSAASFLQSQASNGKRHAINSIPGNIIRFVDTSIQNKWTVNARTRQHWMTESTLTSLFFNRILSSQANGFRTITSATICDIFQARA